SAHIPTFITTLPLEKMKFPHNPSHLHIPTMRSFFKKITVRSFFFITSMRSKIKTILGRFC
ncbi:hypothetical protein, partial [Escherichia coli]|uniref:hypothetical protein n=1 Tax=Escherichia coli TaxID=562 RepID=UPI001BFC0F0A